MITPVNDSNTINQPTDYKGRSISFYHPNSKGTGSALRIEPRFNRDDNDRYNCFFIELAPQKTTFTRNNGKLSPATFDWSRKITVKLGFLDIAELLTVLEGRAPNVGGERNGLYHANGSSNTLITFQRYQDRNAYYLGVSCKRGKDNEPQKVGISLSDVEATGLRSLLQTGLFFVTFSSLFSQPATRIVRRRTVTSHREEAGAMA